MFKIQLDINDYWTGDFVTIGNLPDSVEVESLPDVSEPVAKRRCYKYNRETSVLEFDEEKYNSTDSSTSTGNASVDSNSIISARKSQMVKQSKQNLEKFLESVKMKSSVHRGVEEYYTVSRDKQNDLSSILQCYSLAQTLGTTSVLKWNATGKSCEDWTIQELAALALEMQAFVLPYAEQQRIMETNISEATTLAELDSIDISFSVS